MSEASTLLISDLHLDPERPAATDAFLDFLRQRVAGGDRLFILGDLFEAWVGDDDDAAWLVPVRAGLAAASAAGVDCALIHGNRDFLLGSCFSEETGVRLLDEFVVEELGGERVLLTHGDLLCTDDTRYMTLRGQLRDADWQADFLARSLAERRRIAADLRELSQTEMAAKAATIMDVNQGAVEAAMRRFDVRTLIHGHTHRPDFHRWQLDGRPALRIDLGDWYESASALVWDRAGPRRISLDR